MDCMHSKGNGVEGGCLCETQGLNYTVDHLGSQMPVLVVVCNSKKEMERRSRARDANKLTYQAPHSDSTGVELFGRDGRGGGGGCSPR
jgi:hypothetical protein